MPGGWNELTHLVYQSCVQTHTDKAIYNIQIYRTIVSLRSCMIIFGPRARLATGTESDERLQQTKWKAI